MDDSSVKSSVDGDDALSHNDESTSTGHGESPKGSSEQDMISKLETRAVWRLKLAVLLALATSAALVATTTYFFLSRNEESQFRKQFEEDLDKILNAVGSSLDKTFGLLDSVAVTMVSAARMTNQTWPFVTIPDFSVRMAKLMPLTDALIITVLPLVTPAQRSDWEAYADEHIEWVNEGVKVQSNWAGYYGPVIYDWTPNEQISGDFGPLDTNTNRSMTPTWQAFPVVPNLTWSYNYDWLSISFTESYVACLEHHTATMSKTYMIPSPGDTVAEAETKIWAESFRPYVGPDEETMEPITDIAYPIVDEISRVTVAGGTDYNPAEHKVLGMIASTMYYRSMIRNILPKGSNGIQIVFENPCTDSFTYQINGPVVEYLGVKDYHQAHFDHWGHTVLLHDLSGLNKASMYTGARPDREFCPMTLSIYPSDVMRANFTTQNPTIFTVAVIVIFSFSLLVFVFYDAMVERRQKKVLGTAVRSSAIVSSLFPSTVRDRLYTAEQKSDTLHGFAPETAKGRLHSFLRDSKTAPDTNGPDKEFVGPPIAELYPETTVLFADICGFTAWSSTRQPSQVFTLLETLYAGFDGIARQRGVFKVETIGDSYVAVVGLPTPRKHHAVVMARFANDCRFKMAQVTRELDKALGPGTAELSLRIGLNSGPTTAGVLRGEKSRFQLFGDTVNTAARMESSGLTHKIHVSLKTAELMKAAGKGHWLTLREDEVNCKGKGVMTTYWCEPNAEGAGHEGRSVASKTDNSDLDDAIDASVDNTRQRLIRWSVDMFSGLLADLIQQKDNDGKTKTSGETDTLESDTSSWSKPIDEVAEVLTFPDPTTGSRKRVDDAVLIKSSVRAQVKELISSIANLYCDNPFHNFDHCCHVAMSTKKLLDRITEGGIESSKKSPSMNTKVSKTITDPLAQLAIIFAAFAHDVDHPGVSNSQLVKENHPLATTYDGKSVAEQNSIDIAWRLLMAPQFSELRKFMFATELDMKRFRQVALNAVMATDLFDKELKAMRESRWEKSFTSVDALIGNNDSDRRATIIIDLIIQASDVSHTMQHFTIYKKWNMHLLIEMYDAFKCGRLTKDPTEGWYEGELWFFDNYVIPLAQKLRECGVFGVACDEFLDYAKDNRMEWEMKGKSIVHEAKEELLRCTPKEHIQLRVEM